MHAGMRSSVKKGAEGGPAYTTPADMVNAIQVSTDSGVTAVTVQQPIISRS